MRHLLRRPMPTAFPIAMKKGIYLRATYVLNAVKRAVKEIENSQQWTRSDHDHRGKALPITHFNQTLRKDKSLIMAIMKQRNQRNDLSEDKS